MKKLSFYVVIGNLVYKKPIRQIDTKNQCVARK